MHDPVTIARTLRDLIAADAPLIPFGELTPQETYDRYGNDGCPCCTFRFNLAQANAAYDHFRQVKAALADQIGVNPDWWRGDIRRAARAWRAGGLHTVRLANLAAAMVVYGPVAGDVYGEVRPATSAENDAYRHMALALTIALINTRR
ncbi:hypothetical protein LO763_22675 [Glycomyces sp. A-F 0318]|uniref:hypothetical protein n=1 Tax=Glycomyces amatae TaxID=2881355 RepID=UPI001E33ACD6|nr:hypothetical protein [Glycomyces amatae]MCD0446425.1 hypothetical protein [Glycomyces amatae]